MWFLWGARGVLAELALPVLPRQYFAATLAVCCTPGYITLTPKRGGANGAYAEAVVVKSVIVAKGAKKWRLLGLTIRPQAGAAGINIGFEV